MLRPPAQTIFAPRGSPRTDYRWFLMSLKQRIHTVLRYPPRRWADLVVAVCVAARVEYALGRGGLKRSAEIARVRVGMTGTAAEAGTLADVDLSSREREKLDTAWRLLRHPPFNGTCLRRALVGAYFLHDREPLLRIGVTKKDGVVAAHAWLEVDGVSLDPDGTSKYAVMHAPKGDG